MELERTITGGGDTTDGWSKTMVGGPPEAPRSDALVEGARLGRYVVLGRLGEGGMGVVYAAYDPELDRRVALKLLSGTGHSEAARLRMLREAQAMARLQHPNVVAVHDVGAADERVYVAMEHVRGVTLRQWLLQARPAWPQLLEVMRAVARGLIAAHEAGLVHRDVKPENVMIGADGRVRVMDFGLARAEGASGAVEPVTLTSSSPSLLESELTHAGAVVGTPHYMAPEGLVGGTIDARADQFGWCVTCWEALYGELPFGGEDLEARRRAILDGRLRAPPPGSRVPGGVRRALVRGLAGLPERRHPSMVALLAALDAALRRRRWRAAGYVALAMSVGAGLFAAWQRVEARAAAERCAADGAAIAGTWSEEHARRVAGAFAATGQADAAEVFARTRPWLDAYAQAWASARTELCAASSGRAPTRPEIQTGECLEDRRAGLEALVDGVFTRADRATLIRATSVAAQLPPIAECLDPGRTSRTPPPEEPAARARVRELRSRLERASSLQRAGRYDDAAAESEALLRDAEELGWTPLVLETKVMRGELAARRGEFAEAEAGLEEVVLRAEAEGLDRLVADAASTLTFAVGLGLGRGADGARWGRLGLAVLERLGAQDSLGATDQQAALAIVQESRGEFAEAQRLKERVLELRERHLGPEHPSVGTAHDMLGVILMERGDYPAALRALERGLAIRLASLGPDHLELANSYVNTGNALSLLREHARALAMQEEARRIMVAALGPEHPNTATAIENAAVCRYELGEFDAALRTHREALAIRERVLRPTHPHVAASRLGIGDVLRRQGDLAGAASEYRRALAVLEEAHGREHPQVAVALVKLADVQRAQGDLDAALASLERALTIGRSRELPPRARAEIELRLGQALWESGRDRRRGRELIQGAAPTLLADDPDARSRDTQELRAWLAAHQDDLGLALRLAG